MRNGRVQIEKVFSKMKAYLRRHCRNSEHMEDDKHIRAALRTVTSKDMCVQNIPLSARCCLPSGVGSLWES